jgi:hypothetical protein
MTGAEAAVKGADEIEATERRATKEQEQLHTRTAKEEVRAAAERAIDDELLDGIDEAAESSEGEADQKSSSVLLSLRPAGLWHRQRGQPG